MKHSWSEPSRPSERETTRTCTKCGIVRLTRHDGHGFPWSEWFDTDGARIFTTKTPPCTIVAIIA